jgi:hypothetical protein
MGKNVTIVDCRMMLDGTARWLWTVEHAGQLISGGIRAERAQAQRDAAAALLQWSETLPASSKGSVMTDHAEPMMDLDLLDARNDRQSYSDSEDDPDKIGY